MSLITTNTRTKKLFTLTEDILITTWTNEGLSAAKVSANMEAVGFNRSEPSITYRIGRKLKSAESFEVLHDVGTKVVVAAQKQAGKLIKSMNAASASAEAVEAVPAEEGDK